MTEGMTDAEVMAAAGQDDFMDWDEFEDVHKAEHPDPPVDPKAPMMAWSILTNAPEVYDYGLTVKFSNPVLGSKGLRLVECYTEEEEGPGARFRMESQAARYQSGLYVGLVEPSREDYEWYSKRY